MNIGSMMPARIYVRPEKPEWKAAGRLWQGIPGIERTKKGRLYALWYSGGETEQPGNVVILEKSDDDGESWTDGLCVIAHDDPAVRCFDPCIWRDPSGKLWIFWSQSAGFFDGRAGVWASVCRDPDGEPVFSDPVRLFDGIMLNKPIVTGKGEWLFPAALWGREQARMLRELPQEMQEAIRRAQETGNYDDPEAKAADAEYMLRHSSGPVTEDAPECLRRPKRFGREAYVTAWGPNEYTPLGTLRDFNVIGQLGSIREPALVISGGNDLCTPYIAKTMADGIPNSRWELFEFARHMCFVEDLPRYSALLREWFNKD